MLYNVEVTRLSGVRKDPWRGGCRKCFDEKSKKERTSCASDTNQNIFIVGDIGNRNGLHRDLLLAFPATGEHLTSACPLLVLVGCQDGNFTQVTLQEVGGSVGSHGRIKKVVVNVSVSVFV